MHQISHQISQNHAIVYVEDLQVANMSKSAKGDIEQHGKNVKQKTGLNRAILDQSWAEFRRQLAYKLAWNGGFCLLFHRKIPAVVALVADIPRKTIAKRKRILNA